MSYIPHEGSWTPHEQFAKYSLQHTACGISIEQVYDYYN